MMDDRSVLKPDSHKENLVDLEFAQWKPCSVRTERSSIFIPSRPTALLMLYLGLFTATFLFFTVCFSWARSMCLKTTKANSLDLTVTRQFQSRFRKTFQSGSGCRRRRRLKGDPHAKVISWKLAFREHMMPKINKNLLKLNTVIEFLKMSTRTLTPSKQLSKTTARYLENS